MLNELVILEKGLVAAGIKVGRRHADVQSPGKRDALHVRLDESGKPVEVVLLPSDRVSSLWTLRNGKHNSFPYVQWGPLLGVPGSASEWSKDFPDAWHKEWDGLPVREKRKELARCLESYGPNEAVKLDRGLLNSLQTRIACLKDLSFSESTAAVPAVIDRFRLFSKNEASVAGLIGELLEEIGEGNQELIEFGRIALIGQKAKEGKKEKVKGAAFYFDVARDEFECDVADRRHESSISQALSRAEGSGVDSRCDLTGNETSIHAGPFPQPTVGSLGQIYLFSKNKDIEAARRYNSHGDKAMNVGADLVQRLAGALDAISADDRKGRTWRGIPSEKPKKRDLLLAFVDIALDTEVAAILADEDEPADPEQTFLTRTERVIKALRGKAGVDFRKTPVTTMVLRKVDTGNAKAILHRAFSVNDLYDAAQSWSVAEKNLPEWLKLPAKAKGSEIVHREAPHIAPFQLPRLTRLARAHFIREEQKKAKKAEREPVGISAQEALTLFLNERDARQTAAVTLRLVMKRHGILCSGMMHALRRDGLEKINHTKKYDFMAALRAVGLVGLLLDKLDCRKEDYVNEAAFKLGQLLAVADVVHVGYCAHMRGGNTPSTLLGNSVLATAQADPIRALAVLARRWRPYGSWAKRPSLRNEAERLKSSKDRAESRRGWDILKAASQARRVDELCRSLHGDLPRHVDDTFRAELLLGYMAGLPRQQTGPKKDTDLEEME